MFTGIVQAIGTIRRARHDRGGTLLAIAARGLGGGPVRHGESIAVDGVCLTVEAAGRGGLQMRAAPETLRRTTLGAMRPGAKVNLERSLRPVDRMGGHFVFGHVDGIAGLLRTVPDGDAVLYTFAAPPPLMRYLVEKGSVALNGVSLTVFSCTRRTFTVSLIPYTIRHTTLGTLRPGARLNLETDMLARYVERGAAPHRVMRARPARRSSRSRATRS
jgi:riboflavin synthase